MIMDQLHVGDSRIEIRNLPLRAEAQPELGI